MLKQKVKTSQKRPILLPALIITIVILFMSQIVQFLYFNKLFDELYQWRFKTLVANSSEELYLMSKSTADGNIPEANLKINLSDPELKNTKVNYYIYKEEGQRIAFNDSQTFYRAKNSAIAKNGWDNGLNEMQACVNPIQLSTLSELEGLEKVGTLNLKDGRILNLYRNTACKSSATDKLQEAVLNAQTLN